MLPSYMNGADGGLLLYDVNRFESSMSLPSWAKMWRESTKLDTPLYLVGSKMDIAKEFQIPMIENNLNLLKQDLGVDVHFLISSKENQAISDMINMIALEMINFKVQSVRATSTHAFEGIF
jgi:GTPase SAR1 family protein